MFKNLWKRLQNKPWLKILAIILFAFCGVGVILGIIFSAINVSHVNKSKEGVSLSGQVDSKVYVQMNQSEKTDDQLSLVSNDANALVQQLKIQGVNQINAQYGIQNFNGVNYGVIDLFTPLSNNVFSYKTGQSNSDNATQSLDIFLKLNTTYNLQLVNASSLISSTNVNTNFSGTSFAVNAKHNAQLKNGVLSIPLPKKWSLNGWQTEFTKVFPGWNGKASYPEIFGKNPKNMEKKGNNPKKLLVLWENRSGLIQELQLVTMVAYLEENLSSLGGNNQIQNIQAQTQQINAVYNSFTPQEKNFGQWALTDLINVNHLLTLAQDGNDQNFPILELLSQYYSSQIYENSVSKTPGTLNPWVNDPYTYLYSWNFKNLSLVDTFFQTIDYTNFFNFFSYNLKELTKTTFTTTKFVIGQIMGSLTQPQMVAMLNNGSLASPLGNPFLNSFQNFTAAGVQNNANNLSNFLNFIHVTTQNITPSVTGLNAYAGAMVGISILILVIGIIVSVLYRFPGIMATLFSGLVFLITASIYPDVGLNFDFNTAIGLMVTALIPFLLVMNWLSEAKRNIRQGLNLQNATIYGFKSYLKNAITIYLAALLVGITFLFFGQGQLQSFGTVLVVGNLLTILFFVFIYVAIYFVAQWLFITNSPWLVFNKKYCQLLVKISQVKFGTFELKEPDRFNKLFDPNRIRRSWWIVLLAVIFTIAGIIGMIVLGVLGPGFSLYFGSTTILDFTFTGNNPMNSDVINQLAQNLNVTWFKIIEQTNSSAIPQATQTVILETSTHLTPEQVTEAINAVNKNLLPSLVVKYGNHFMPNLLKLNLIDVVMISVAFLSILSFITLNFINVLPIAIILSVIAICATGIIGLCRIPTDTNTLVSYGQVWDVIVVLVFFQFTNYKFDFKMKKRYRGDEIKLLVANKFGQVSGISLLWSSLYLLSTLIMMLFDSTSFVFQILILCLAIFFICAISIPIIPLSFYGTMLIREWYAGKIATTRSNRGDHKNYDKIDEQEIYGLNKH